MRGGSAILLSAAVMGVIASLFVFHPFTPNFPFPGLDPSWQAVMGEAADRPARWGIDTVFTYGPASPLITGYYNGGYFSRTLPLVFGFAALFGWCAALLIAGRSPSGRTLATGTAACGLMVAATHGLLDAFYYGLAFLVFLLALRGRESDGSRAAPAAAALGAFAMGITGMVKMGLPIAALSLFVLVDGWHVAGRRWPRLLPCFGLGILAGALLYGQRLTDLPTYARMQGEVVTGYPAAMALAGPDWDLSAFLALSAALVGAALWAGRRRSPRDATSWLVPLGLAVVLLFLFKGGFIRHDLHSIMAWTGLSLVGTVMAWAWMPRRAALATTVVACAVVLVYVPVLTARQSVRAGRGEALVNLYRAWLIENPGREIAAAVDWLRDPASIRANLDAVKAQAWSDIAAAEPLPPLDGTVDVIPSQQSRVMAAGLRYHGRPSFQEYSTYTARLEDANRAFIQGADAPRWILFGPEAPVGSMALDGRYPGFDEGALWPDLMRLYRPDHRIGALVALERRAVPAPLPMGPRQEMKVGFGDFTPVPEGESPLWASLDVRLNLAGRALSALFRPPLMMMGVRLADGTERWFRFVPGLAEAGFVLSPLVNNASDYEVLATGRPASDGRRVTAVAVQTSRIARLFYASDITLTLRKIDASSLAVDEPVPPTPMTAWEALAGAATPAEDGRISVPLSSDRTPGAGSTTLPLWRLPIVDGRRDVALAYGLAEAEAGAVAAAACFTIRPADGLGATLWHRCLDAAAGNSDTRRSVALAVPASVTELVLEVACTASCDAGSAYWAEPADKEAAH